MGNNPSREEPQLQPPIPPAEPSIYEQYTWAFIAGGILFLVICTCAIKKICCTFKEEKQRHRDQMELHNLQQQQMNSVMQREQYLGPNRETALMRQYSTTRNGNYVNRGLSLQRSDGYVPQPSKNRLVYNTNYNDVHIPYNEPLILPASPHVNMLEYSPMRTLPPAHSYRSDSRRNSYRSLKSQKAIVLPSLNDSMEVIELESVDDNIDVISSRSRAKSQKSINDLIEEKIEEEIGRRVKEEVAKELAKQKSILKAVDDL